MRFVAITAAVVLGITAPSVALAVAMIGGAAGFYALARTFTLARDLNRAINDQHLGIQTVADQAKRLTDPPPGT